MQSEQNRERAESEKRVLEEDMRELGDKKEMVAHWEQQISEIIHWYVVKMWKLSFKFLAPRKVIDSYDRGNVWYFQKI